MELTKNMMHYYKVKTDPVAYEAYKRKKREQYHCRRARKCRTEDGIRLQREKDRIRKRQQRLRKKVEQGSLKEFDFPDGHESNGQASDCQPEIPQTDPQSCIFNFEVKVEDLGVLELEEESSFPAGNNYDGSEVMLSHNATETTVSQTFVLQRNASHYVLLPQRSIAAHVNGRVTSHSKRKHSNKVIGLKKKLRLMENQLIELKKQKDRYRKKWFSERRAKLKRDHFSKACVKLFVGEKEVDTDINDALSFTHTLFEMFLLKMHPESRKFIANTLLRAVVK